MWCNLYGRTSVNFKHTCKHLGGKKKEEVKCYVHYPISQAHLLALKMAIGSEPKVECFLVNWIYI